MTRNRWVIPLVLAVTVFVHYLDRNNLPIVLPQVAREFGWSDQQTGQYGQYLLGAFYLTFGLAQILLSPLAERFGVKRSLMLSILGFSVCTMLFYPLGGSLGALIGLRLLLGLAESVHMPMNSALVSRWFSPHERGRANSIYVAGILVALAVAPLLIVPLTERFGWRMTFALLGFAGLAISLPLVARFVSDRPAIVSSAAATSDSSNLTPLSPPDKGTTPEFTHPVPSADSSNLTPLSPLSANREGGSDAPRTHGSPSPFTERGLGGEGEEASEIAGASPQVEATRRNLVRRGSGGEGKTLWLYIAAGVGNAFCVFGILNWLPTYLNRTRGIEFGDLSLPLFGVFLSGIVGIFFWAYLGDKTGRRTAFASVGLLLAGVCVVLTALAPSNALAIALLALGVFLQSSYNAQEFATLQGMARPDRVGAITGLYNGATVLLGGVGGSLIPGGIVALTGSFQAGLLSVAVGAGLVSLLMAVLTRRM